ncbi:hypothetical protein F2Q69_00041580 [Brassica cretica]|uniref:Uncharacterized protein n=1 Tax=Brassica cretica TaxID=69181 RepID=A0A8S9NIP3_BRACR|nr:hypothetical protein F2Q69_00041580 [Brassica cretica]
MNIFKKKTTPKDALRTSKREMSVATRGIEREISSLQLEEKRLVAEIKKTAKTGNEATRFSPLLAYKHDYWEIEMMSEAIDETLDKDEAEEETEDLTNQVLDEIGVGVASQLSSAPKGRIATKTAAPPATTTNSNSSESSEVDELEKRLASLRRI